MFHNVIGFPDDYDGSYTFVCLQCSYRAILRPGKSGQPGVLIVQCRGDASVVHIGSGNSAMFTQDNSESWLEPYRERFGDFLK